jgi:hypothetical protein
MGLLNKSDMAIGLGKQEILFWPIITDYSEACLQFI